MRKAIAILGLAVLMLGLGDAPSLAPSRALAQVRTVDPNEAIDSDLGNAPARRATPQRAAQQASRAAPSQPAPARGAEYPAYPDPSPRREPDTQATQADAGSAQAQARAASATGETYQVDDLLSAAEGVFGKGASGLAGILQRTLKEQGQPNAYIAGREGSGAIVFGLRYGKGTMFHKVEGQQPVYWTGPSVGFDLGGDANKVFVLVYNLYDSEDLYRRFPAAEGRVYFVGGFAATYLRRGKIVLIPIRLGVGWRQGVNLGYMKFSHKQRWLPF